jgi:hypothetical protein
LCPRRRHHAVSDIATRLSGKAQTQAKGAAPHLSTSKHPTQGLVPGALPGSAEGAIAHALWGGRKNPALHLKEQLYIIQASSKSGGATTRGKACVLLLRACAPATVPLLKGARGGKNLPALSFQRHTRAGK